MGTQKRTKIILTFLLLLYVRIACALTTTGTLMLLNDSPFILTATVYTHYGEFLGQSTLQPGQQSSFTTNLYSTPINRPGTPPNAITPYRIIWLCPSGSIYSMCPDGATGSLIRATQCAGPLVCSPKKQPEPPQTNPALPDAPSNK